ncbi:mitotic-spindle organizing gamma-tubulin ring associated-domain-containing protein [Chaetomium fimeti]|uniref:Mitotic-spindle organizing protein 1 n=1 Tax=Chaetomium fimeti TaxID=1854472 RepID=A0AAE0HK44_9PEZI|nr:mitotic-spindle organizing gamma-tubulin ring associated-domain-containing protein [Chaetomium fimeti]
MPPTDRAEKQAAAQQAVNILHEISTILNCHLDRQTLSICISMIEKGINPEALAHPRQSHPLIPLSSHTNNPPRTSSKNCASKVKKASSRQRQRRRRHRQQCHRVGDELNPILPPLWSARIRVRRTTTGPATRSTE